MNGLFLAVIIILCVSMIYGYFRGFVRILFSLVSFVLMLFLVSWLNPYVTNFIIENTSIYSDIEKICTEKIKIKTEEEAKKEVDEKDLSIAGIQLPKVLEKQLKDLTTQSAGELLETNGVYQRVGSYLAEWIVKGIAFLASLLLAVIILKLAVGMLDILSRLPVIKGVNKTIGIVAGLLQGLIIVWLFMFLVAISCTSDFGQNMLGYINDNDLLTFLYNYNGVVWLFNFMLG